MNTARCAASVGFIPALIKSLVISSMRLSSGVTSVSLSAAPTIVLSNCSASFVSCARSRPSAMRIAASPSIPVRSTKSVAICSTFAWRASARCAGVSSSSVGSTRVASGERALSVRVALSSASVSSGVSLRVLASGVPPRKPFCRIKLSAVGTTSPSSVGLPAMVSTAAPSALVPPVINPLCMTVCTVVSAICWR